MARDDDIKNQQNIALTSITGVRSAIGKAYLKVAFPPDPVVWRTARKLISAKNFRVSDFAVCAIQDPVLVIEILKKANMVSTSGTTTVSSLQSAITCLGSIYTQEILNELTDRPPYEDDDVRKTFEKFRNNGRRAAIVARIIAEVLAQNYSDECQTAAVLTPIGNMLALDIFNSEYINIFNEANGNFSKINYQLVKRFSFDVEAVRNTYLQTNGVPARITSILDRERPLQENRFVIRLICLAAVEMVEFFDNDAWEKLSKKTTLPSKSTLRLLKFRESQYEKIYDRVTEYLLLAKESSKTPNVPHFFESDLLAEEAPEEVAQEAPERDPFDDLDIGESFGLNNISKEKEARSDGFQIIEPPKIFLRTKSGEKIIREITTLFQGIDNGEELITSLLEKLIQIDLFEKSALIVVSKDKKYAIVVAARGPNISNGQHLRLDDILSPLSQRLSKIISFGTEANVSSPFGSKTFALAPIDANYETNVFLYADCGNNESVPFEARRVFRTAVEMLNQYLPIVKGSIPNELKDF